MRRVGGIDLRAQGAYPACKGGGFCYAPALLEDKKTNANIEH